jgi:hypothetical protein
MARGLNCLKVSRPVIYLAAAHTAARSGCTSSFTEWRGIG